MKKKVIPRTLMVELPEDVMMRLVKWAAQENMTVHAAAADILTARLT
jgi:hypothetical protein